MFKRLPKRLILSNVQADTETLVAQLQPEWFCRAIKLLDRRIWELEAYALVLRGRRDMLRRRDPNATA